jgi:hypothetical protein
MKVSRRCTVVVSTFTVAAIRVLYVLTKIIAEDDEGTVRLQSVAKLLATMPMAHYDTLKALIGYFYK